MNKVFELSKWIWNCTSFSENEYSEFYDIIDWETGKTEINISVFGDYTLFVNGKYVASNQYGDYAHYKVYDTIDISNELSEGKNTIAILVWYLGGECMRYLTETPGLIYEVLNDGKIIAKSDETTLSRKSRAYESGEHIHKISPQLSYSFKYNLELEDNWLNGEGSGFSNSVVILEKSDFYKRPIPKHDIKPLRCGNVTEKDGRYIIDLGEEIVGLCSFCVITEKAQNINVSYGELLYEGHVKRIIRNRDFSFDVSLKQGKNEYTNYMLRLACRFIEIDCENPIDIEYVGILPQVFDVKPATKPSLGDLDSKIYDICVNTLNLCMMEHYVDCPWREQCLYIFDSRNQMLSGYYAYENKNLDYARANLLLFSKDRRDDKLFSICSPCSSDLVIPSFSLYYAVAVNEYLNYSGDLSLGEEVIGKIEEVIGAFVKNMKNGMFTKFPGKNHWNYYDWSKYAEGKLFQDDDDVADFMINCIGVYALKAYDAICKKLSRQNKFEGVADTIAKNVGDKFFNPDTNTFYIENIEEDSTELANSFAILSGIADDDLAKSLANRIANNEFLPCSLSMRAFKYDALLCVSKEKYKGVVLDEIRTTYKKMLDEGCTTVWEKERGAGGVNEAGSLCHGWSAIPIYYYHTLKDED